MNRQDYDHEFILPGQLIVQMHFLSNGNLLAVTPNSLISIDRNGEGRELFEFQDGRLGGFLFEDGVIILHLLDYGVGHSGSLLRLDESGTVRAEMATENEILSMSYTAGFLAVLYSDGAVFYDNSFNESLVFHNQSLSGVSRIFALADGLAIGTGEHTAVAIRTYRSE